MYRVFRTKWYKTKLNKLDSSDQKRALNFEQSLKIEPYSGKPLGYAFFREKKFDNKRILFLIYKEYKCIFLITITDKKAQQKEINLILSNLDLYKTEIKNLIKKI
jgi:mRNA-degrading endonuclease RelE of RelBE toxin-antitoxin system